MLGKINKIFTDAVVGDAGGKSFAGDIAILTGDWNKMNEISFLKKNRKKTENNRNQFEKTILKN